MSRHSGRTERIRREDACPGMTCSSPAPAFAVPSTASCAPWASCRPHRAMSSRRCRVCFVAGRRSTDWRQFPVCGSCRAVRRQACSSGRRPRSDRPNPRSTRYCPSVSTAHAVGNAGLGHFRKDFAVRNLSGPDIQRRTRGYAMGCPALREAGVEDIELLLVGREGNAVGLDEVVDDYLDVARFRIHPVHVLLFLLGLGFDALIIAADAVDGIGEPDRAIGSDDRVVRRVQFLAIVLVGDDGDRAVEFGPGDPSAAVFARDQRPSRSMVLPLSSLRAGGIR